MTDHSKGTASPLPCPVSGCHALGRREVERRRDEILASADKRFPPSPEYYDALFARFAPVVGNSDAAALARLVVTLKAAPVLPDYEAGLAIERLFAKVAYE